MGDTASGAGELPSDLAEAVADAVASPRRTVGLTGAEGDGATGLIVTGGTVGDGVEEFGGVRRRRQWLGAAATQRRDLGQQTHCGESLTNQSHHDSQPRL